MFQSSLQLYRTKVPQFLAMLCAAAILNPGKAHSGILTGPIVNPANGNSYYLLESATWIHSQFEARQLGGNLTTINNADEDNWVVNNFRNFGGTARNLWTGLNDARTPDTFEWVSGDPASYRGWANGQPDNFFGNQVYVAIAPAGFLRGEGWGDQNEGTADFLGTPYHGVVEVESGDSPPQLDPVFAFSNFDEPGDGDSSFTPGSGSSELGFRTEIFAQDGATPTLGKATTSTTPTSPIFFHSSLNARTTFDPVDLDGWSAVTVKIDVAARLTTYEDGDFLRVFVREGDGGEEVDLIHLEEEEINQIAGLSYFSISAEVPEGWTEVQLIVESSTNSTQDAERVDFDNIAFSSPFPQGSNDIVFSGAKDLVVNANEDGTATVDFSTISAVDSEGEPLAVSCTPTDSEPFPVGVHDVVCQATDGFGRTASASFQLIVLERRKLPEERIVNIVALRKDPAPRGALDEVLPKSANFRIFNRAVLNNGGDILLEVEFDDTSTSALYTSASGTLTPVAAATGPEFDAGDQRGRFWNLALNDAGQHAFEANTSGGDTQYAGGVSAAAEGQVAPGGDGAKFAHLHKPALDGSGGLFTLAHLTRQPIDPEVTRYNDTGLWGSRGGLIAREGEPSPLENFHYGHLLSRVVASDGKIAFATNLSPAPASAIFTGEPNSLEAVVKSGDPAPGTTSTFDDFHSESLNAAGDLVFRATLAIGGDINAANNSGLWMTRGGDLELVAREGVNAPCLPADSPAMFDRIADTSIGADGTIFFHAFLAGDNVDSSNDGSLWRKSPDGELHLIAREGDITNNAAGVYRRISSFVSNDVGGIAFFAELVFRSDEADFVTRRATGVWLDRGDGPAPQLMLRRGDQIEVEPGEPQLITLLRLDAQNNAYGGSGGYGRLLNDNGQLLVRLSLTDNLSGVFLAEAPKKAAIGEALLAPKQAAFEKSLPAPKRTSKRLPADRPSPKISKAKIKVKTVATSPVAKNKPESVRSKSKSKRTPPPAAKSKTVPVAENLN